MIQADGLTKAFKVGSEELRAVDDVNISVKPGEFVLILGRSGSGKSTLLGMLAGLIRPTSGTVRIRGKEIGGLSDDGAAELRAKEIGFIFQFSGLIPTITAHQNVLLPTLFCPDGPGSRLKAVDLLKKVGLSHRENAYPRTLSSGEMKRVAIARALINEPSLLIADEPTGDLDVDTEIEIMDLFRNLNREGTTIVMVTHNPDLVPYATRTYGMVRGKLVNNPEIFLFPGETTAMNRKMDYFTFIVAGIRNKPGRNIATIFCFAFIAANIFSGQFLIAGAEGGVDRGISRMGADQIVVPSQYTVFLRGSGTENTMAIVRAEPSVWRLKASIMDRIGKVQNVSVMSPQLYVTTLNLNDTSKTPVDIYGIDPATDFTIRPWLQKPLDKNMSSGEIIVGSSIPGAISSRISIQGHDYTIAGRLDPTQSPIDTTVFLGMDDAYSLAATNGILPPASPRILKGEVNAILIRDSPGESPDSVETRIKRLFSSPSEFRVISVIGKHFSLDPVSEDIKAIPGILNSLSAFVVIIALPLIALIAAMVTNERQREIGLLKSMGAKRNVVFFLVIAESLVLAAVGGIAGVCASILAISAMSSQGVLNGALQVSFRTPALPETVSMAALALLVVIAIGSIASLWPAYRSSRMNAYDAIRN